MRDLLLLFLRYGGFLLFLLLESISFWLIVRYNKNQRAILDNTIHLAIQRIDERIQNITDYLSLSKINEEVVTHNAQLLDSLVEQKVWIQKVLSECTSDSLRIDSTTFLHVYPARVISNTINSSNNLFIIDKGQKDGIRPRMGVLSMQGVAGIVKATNAHYSLVIPLINRQARLSAMLARSGYFGSLLWEGPQPNTAWLEDIPNYADVTLGDLVITSGYSAIFPPGIPVGKVIGKETPPGGGFVRLKVALNTDFARLHYVYVLKMTPPFDFSSLQTATQ